LDDAGWVDVDDLLAAAGARFTRSANGVWLVDAVSPERLRVLG
jgi:RNA:NAD 2'-phosphotransferase (TPT1/KptA family)